MDSNDLCIYCSKTCRERQQSLQCDFCDRWQHRTCQTGISQDFYRKLSKGLEVLPDWKCYICSTPPGNVANAILEEELDIHHDESNPSHDEQEDIGPPASEDF